MLVPRPNRIVVKHHLGRIVAVIEILSPGNKDSRAALRDFAEKAIDFLDQGIHLLLVDLFPPTIRDPFKASTRLFGTNFWKKILPSPKAKTVSWSLMKPVPKRWPMWNPSRWVTFCRTWRYSWPATFMFSSPWNRPIARPGKPVPKNCEPRSKPASFQKPMKIKGKRH